MLTNLSLISRIKEKEGTITICGESLVIFFILAFNFTIAKGQDLKIDSQLRILANDCYTRIAIGTRLPDSNVISTTTGKSLTDCESICSINRTRCNAFNYGVDSRGNGTCVIGRIDANSKPEDLTIDPDYDVYERRQRSPVGCQHDRLLKISYGDAKFGDSIVPLSSSSNKRTLPFGGQKNVPATKIFGNLFADANATDTAERQKSSFFRGGWHSPIADDTDARLYDILNDKNSHRTLGHHAFEISYESPNEHHRDSQFRDDGRADLCSRRVGFLEDVPIFCKIFRSTTTATKGATIARQPNQQNFHEPNDFSAGYGTKIDSILRKSMACYRKLLTGKRLLENHVRRRVECDRIEECHRVCEYESTFVCEGFNYGRMKHITSHGRGHDEERPHGYICQLTSVSGGRMNPRRDFVDDSRYDYYVRDWTCPAGKVHRDSFERDWPSNLPTERTNDQHKWQTPSFPPSYSSGGSYEHPLLDENTRYYYPSDRLSPSGNRPSDYDYYPRHQAPWRSYLPQRPSYNEIIRHSRLPPGGLSTSVDDRNHRYYYGAEDDDFGKFPRRRIDVRRNWLQEPPGPNDITQQPGFVYGNSYGYGKESEKRPKGHPVRDNSYRSWDKSTGEKFPNRQDHHYDFVYGPAYGYQSGQGSIDSYDSSRWKSAVRPNGIGAGGMKHCSTRSLMGFKLSRNIVVASYTVGNLDECETLCLGRIDCLSFAYRYSLVPAAPTDNCHLGDVSFEKLNFYTDLEPERDYDVYAMAGNPRNCQGELSQRPRLDRTGLHGYRSEECFWRVRSGYGIPQRLVREETRVENGLGECQSACIGARHFTCRSFVFRYDFGEDRGPNCFLSDCPTREIILAVDNESGSFNRRQQSEMYERGSYGRGCETHPFVPIYNSLNFGGKPQMTGEDCYSGYQAGCKLSTDAVASVSRADTENECRRQCSKMRHSPDSPPCMSFSFRIGDEKHGDNCYLSDVPRRDLRPGLDYTYDDDYVMYTWKELEPYCSSHYGKAYDDPPKNDETITYASGGVDYRSQFTPTAGGFVPSPDLPGIGLYSYNTLFLGARPFDADRPDFSRPPGPSTGTWSPHDEASADGYLPRPDYHGLSSFNLHYTVNGYPCKRGTKCEINKIAGFWSCEPEGSEFGSWDYCCEPNHHCGFSQGYSYPWCYVGASEEQWRPCSDKYFPYLPSPRPAIGKIPNENVYLPDKNARIDPPFYRYEKHRQNIQDSTFCQQGRHWPIAYLHPVPPPNTTDSVALANNRRDSNEYKEKSVAANENHIKTNATVKDDRTSKRSFETTSSPSVRIRTYKSHLKRRGLEASANSTILRINDELTKKRNEKLSRIFTVAAKNMTNNVSPRTNSSFRADYYVSKSNDAAKIKIKRVKEDIDDLFVNANNDNSTIARDKTRYGRVERVTKANNIIGHAETKK